MEWSKETNAVKIAAALLIKNNKIAVVPAVPNTNWNRAEGCRIQIAMTCGESKEMIHGMCNNNPL